MTGHRRFRLPRVGEDVDPAFLALLASIERDADRLDSRFIIPWTRVRFGWDPVLGVIPVLGDIAGAVLAVALISKARRLGVSRATARRMTINAAIDVGLGIIPLAGPVLDIFCRANARNLKLVLDEVGRQRGLPVT